jgi:hypothetical protein
MLDLSSVDHGVVCGSSRRRKIVAKTNCSSWSDEMSLSARLGIQWQSDPAAPATRFSGYKRASSTGPSIEAPTEVREKSRYIDDHKQAAGNDGDEDPAKHVATLRV